MSPKKNKIKRQKQRLEERQKAWEDDRDKQGRKKPGSLKK